MLGGEKQQEKSLKSRQAGSSSPYSAGRDLQFSTEDGLVLTIPNNILISQPYTDQILCQEQQKCSSANTPVWNSSSTGSLGQPTHPSTQQSPKWLPKVPFSPETIPSEHKVSTDVFNGGRRLRAAAAAADQCFTMSGHWKGLQRALEITTGELTGGRAEFPYLLISWSWTVKS